MGSEAAASQATLLHEHDSGKIQSQPTETQKIVNGYDKARPQGRERWSWYDLTLDSLFCYLRSLN